MERLNKFNTFGSAGQGKSFGVRIAMPNLIFQCVREQLPMSITNDIIQRISEQCYERIKLLQMEESTLLNNLRASIDDEDWEGDIHLFQLSSMGISWVFDRETGKLHTT